MPLDQDLQYIQEVRKAVEQAKNAQKSLARFSQATIDKIVCAMVGAGYEAAEYLAKLAVEETKMGRVESKIIKNQFATRDLWQVFSNTKTVGVLRVDKDKGIMEVGGPVGVIAGIIPTTNPTSTALFKSIIAIKAGNAIVLAPHPRAVRCTCEAARIVYEAAVSSGAPEGCISCLSFSSLEATNALMRHQDTSMILATGGAGLVKSAYSSGKPAYGVGPGNSPAFIERTACVKHAVNCIVESQLFDYGTICSSEQSVVVDASIQKEVTAEFIQRGGYFLSPTEHKMLEKMAFPKGNLNPEVVGQSAERIAQMAGFSVPPNTSVILVPLEGVGEAYPLSKEKLSPILGWYIVKDWMEGCHICYELLELGGMGHTLSIHSTDTNVVMEFALKKPASRILVNAPTSQGAIGSATYLTPSLTLGCGTSGGNITSDNISPFHLIQVKRVALLNKNFPFWENRDGGYGGVSPDDFIWMEKNDKKDREDSNIFSQPSIKSKKSSVFTGGVYLSQPPVENRIIIQKKSPTQQQKGKEEQKSKEVKNY